MGPVRGVGLWPESLTGTQPVKPLSADAVGYSRHIGEDEAITGRTLETYKEGISELLLLDKSAGIVSI